MKNDKAEGGGENDEVRNPGAGDGVEWWAGWPAEERRVLGDILRMVSGLKRSQVPLVARAARIWESKLAFFLKVQLRGSGGNNGRPRRRGGNGQANH